MKYILLTIIKAYWFFIPAKNRTRCIFKESCSHHVFDKTKTEGFLSGLKAFRFRYQNCRPGYYVLPTQNETILVTAKNVAFSEKEIDSRILTQQNL